jgi:hypothetical protein
MNLETESGTGQLGSPKGSFYNGWQAVTVDKL